MKITLSAQSGLSLYNAWVMGLDYVELDGMVFGMFNDGIWLIKSDTVVMDNKCKLEFMGLPSIAWGCNA